jgi:hypothetical protein
MMRLLPDRDSPTSNGFDARASSILFAASAMERRSSEVAQRDASFLSVLGVQSTLYRLTD